MTERMKEKKCPTSGAELIWTSVFSEIKRAGEVISRPVIAEARRRQRQPQRQLVVYRG